MAHDPNGCPACGQVHPANTLICPITGVSLRFSDPQKAVGEVIGGKYRIDSVLGRGGMGAVYEAEHLELEKKVAIKILLPESSVKPKQVERFKREARSAASIGHDNIVQIFDLDTTQDGAIYIVMELLPGQDLGDLLSSKSRGLAVGRVARIAAQAAAGLGAAHEHDIIHRDLKPENIFLAQKPQGEQVKIVDFGIAMMRHGGAGRLTAEGVLIGTPYYMSPEQARGERNLTPQTDIYALGTVLYEMLTGAVLFDGDTYLEILAKHQVDAPPPLVDRRPGLDCPAELESLINQMLEKDRAKRPGNMAEIAAILERFEDHEGDAPAAPAGKGKQGYAETILAYQQPREAPSTQAAPGHEPGETHSTVKSDASLEWSSDGGPSPTTMIRKDTRRRKVMVVAVLLGLVVAAGIAAAVVTGLGTAAGKDNGNADPPVKESGSGTGQEEQSMEPASVEQVTIEVDVSPEIAVISVDGVKIEGNPISLEVDQGMSVTLRAEAHGYTTVEKEFVASKSRSFSWQLEPLSTKRPKGKTGKTSTGGAPPEKTGSDDGGGKGKKKIKVDKDNPYLSGS
ncbi:MAG: serine/threonine protein kinase [Deltaproteobacteria bacterium]|nr:serine/threonine protein kinase [Deltaproteobacteria bacterium]